MCATDVHDIDRLDARVEGVDDFHCILFLFLGCLATLSRDLLSRLVHFEATCIIRSTKGEYSPCLHRQIFPSVFGLSFPSSRRLVPKIGLVPGVREKENAL